jgi:hypothetical protein
MLAVNSPDKVHKHLVHCKISEQGHSLPAEFWQVCLAAPAATRLASPTIHNKERSSHVAKASAMAVAGF